LALGLRGSLASGWEGTLSLGTGAGSGFRENAAFLFAGYAVGRAGSTLFASAALDLGGGAVLQTIDGASAAWSPALAAGVHASTGVVVAERLALTLEGWLPAVLVRRDDQPRVVLMPALLLGAVVPL
jgi:hypothetical protein